jgi:hypothetical protein
LTVPISYTDVYLMQDERLFWKCVSRLVEQINRLGFDDITVVELVNAIYLIRCVISFSGNHFTYFLLLKNIKSNYRIENASR